MAEEVNVNRFADLAKDPYANFNEAVRAYIFRDKEVIEELVKVNDETSTFLIRNYLEVNLILESTDHKYVSGLTIQGGSEILGYELYVFRGLPPQQMVLGNEYFEYYLKCLYMTGYITFENDPYYEVACQRVREDKMRGRLDIF
ncbi:pyruvate kinase [Paenibacillus assamensis]|uniref:pyruvate kinase n=1 Tax=Paenibacillus assamensis TaxID=311244 RepID=UPI00040EAABD|nr:pyruvate kinase [Paenibacillus assamensis]